VHSVFLVLAHDRRRILQAGVTAHPTAEGRRRNGARHFRGTALRDICRTIATGSPVAPQELKDLGIREVLGAPVCSAATGHTSSG